MDNQEFESSVLWRQKYHKSQQVWDRTGDVKEVKVLCSTPWPVNDRVLPFVEGAGFGGIAKLGRIILDHSLLSALVERWRRETHTFHLRVGEMTVTLQDVAMILGLPIDGSVVTDVVPGPINVRSTCIRLLGVAPPAGDDDGGGAGEGVVGGAGEGVVSGAGEGLVGGAGEGLVGGVGDDDGNEEKGRNAISLRWLRDTFSGMPPENANDDVLRQYARAYILYVLGSFLFSDAKASFVPSMYLPLLENLDQTRGYSWGSATLAHLYRGLCEASEKGKAFLKGCTLLLQIWCWEHFHLGRPEVKMTNQLQNAPLGACWNGAKSYKACPKACLTFYRDELDQQENNQVIWMPYESRLLAASPICLEGNDIWLSCVPLIHFHEVEWYRPNRVLRQFGYVQNKPAHIHRDEDNFHGINRRGKVSESWAVNHAKEIAFWNDRRARFPTSLIPGNTTSDDYNEWYISITKNFIGRLTSRNLPNPPALEYHPRGLQMQKMIDNVITGTYQAFAAKNEDWISFMKKSMTDAGEVELFEQIARLNVNDSTNESQEIEPSTSQRKRPKRTTRR